MHTVLLREGGGGGGWFGERARDRRQICSGSLNNSEEKTNCNGAFRNNPDGQTHLEKKTPKQQLGRSAGKNVFQTTQTKRKVGVIMRDERDTDAERE